MEYPWYFPHLKIHQIFFCILKGKIKNWTLFTNFHIPKHYNQTSNQLPNSQIWKEPQSTTGELNPGPPAPLTSLFPLDHASFLWKFAELSNIKWKLIKEKDYGISVIHYRITLIFSSLSNIKWKFIKRRIRKWLRNIRNIFLIFEEPHIFLE